MELHWILLNLFLIAFSAGLHVLALQAILIFPQTGSEIRMRDKNLVVTYLKLLA